MKKVTKCENCKKIIRIHGSFTASIEQTQIIGGVDTGVLKTSIIKLCRPCTKLAGYKVKEKE